MPPSPLEAEKARLGEGFLTAEASPYLRRRILSDAQREEIGRSARPTWELAEEYGVSEVWVNVLRRKYYRGEL